MRTLFYALGLFIVIVIGNTIIVAQENMKPPIARKETKVTKINGYDLKDDYGWLRSAKDPKTGKIDVVAGDGKKGNGPGGIATQCQLARPHGVFIDTDGTLYIGDSENHVLRALKVD